MSKFVAAVKAGVECAVELDELGEDVEGIELTCHFCEKKYKFTPEGVRNLAEMAKRP